MRTTNERVETALDRAEIMKKRQKKRRLQGGMIATIAGSFCVLVIISSFLPTMITADMMIENSNVFSASIFSNSTVLGYIMIGILSFALGIVATILCILLRNKVKEIDEDLK